MMEASAGTRLALLGESFRRLTGRDLGPDIWSAEAAILAHDTSTPPRFIYGNARTLALFRMTPAQFLGLPSHLSAEPAHREERARMFAKLEADDVVFGYAGVRIAADGTRFRISDAVIWNLVDEAGVRHGQAAWFERVEML
ncbi:MEKHLA domain-containing protein [Altererythrobacter buctensis]|uniref:MEKHLA domain-containing protein n=2 Tax=Alteraurantiacibacter buctensis TaxID=1503981 RepID=A0A844YW53_9SPHN|nr:MEKHLA domain-containing protein [Alteraurantiacibacter buctensis]